MSTQKATQRIGVQSYCFRHFRTTPEVIEKVKALGLDRLELCRSHADFTNPEAFRETAAQYRDAGLTIDSIGVEAFHGYDSERAIFESAAIAGAKTVSAHFAVGTYPQAIRRVREWAREFGVRVGIHCHGGYMFGGSPDVLEHLIGLGGPEIGVWIDTAWAMQIGPRLGKPVEWVKRFSGSIYGVHYKDFTFEANGQWRDTIIGEGTLDLPAFLNALEEDGFDGPAILEYEGDVENPVPALTRCVAAIRAHA